jgi:hypothetical protein
VLSSVTVRATPKVLACRVRFTAVYKTARASSPTGYTIDLLANGKSHINFRLFVLNRHPAMPRSRNRSLVGRRPRRAKPKL